MTRACRLLLAALLLCSCGERPLDAAAPAVPRGYYARLELLHEGRQLAFGPFVGYYFKPLRPDDLSRLQLLCFNERGFYTDQLPVNVRLFEGDAVLAELDASWPMPQPKQRINPVFFDQAPPTWLAGRPEPNEEFLHFHSAYDQRGAVYTGFWLRHRPVAAFTYNMGGRVGEASPLYHRAEPGHAGAFPRIIEFDQGPGWIEPSRPR